MKPARRLIALALAATLAAAAAGPARAGRACETRPLAVAEVAQGLALAQATARALDASGAQVLVLARAGQDLSRWGLRWSHLGLAWRDRSADGAPVWRVTHKLNHCGSDRAQLYHQGLGDFFLDRPHRLEAAWLPLAPAVQAALLPRLRGSVPLSAWHEPRYSMVAYPWATRYQQSNQWVLETLAGALAPAATDRTRAQAWLQAMGYQPTVLTIGALTRLGARVTQAHIAFDDHPNDKRFADRIETVSVESVFAFLQRAGLADGAPRVVRPSDTISPTPEGDRT